MQQGHTTRRIKNEEYSYNRHAGERKNNCWHDAFKKIKHGIFRYG